jgi:hypothetical protein
MHPAPPSRRVSRETRRLLAAALVAIVALWVLARIRFPNQSSTPNPIPSLLSQLSTAPRFANLAGEIAELQSRLSGAWVSLPVVSTDQASPSLVRHRSALRLNDNAAIVLLHGGARPIDDASIMAIDRVTGLGVLRVPLDPGPSGVVPWVPPSLQDPRYLMATLASPDGVSLRPILVGSLRESRSPAWPGPIWAAPEGTDLEAGAFAFTPSGENTGLPDTDRRWRVPSAMATQYWKSRNGRWASMSRQ